MLKNTIYTKSFIALLFANMFFWMSTNFFLPILPIYYHGLGMNDREIGFAIGAFSIGTVLFRVLSGKAVDRYGGHLILNAGIVVSILAIASYYYSNTLLSAILSRFFHGVGISGYAAAALTLATLLHEPRHTTEAVSAYTLFTMLGVGLATSSANWIFGTGQMMWIVIAGVIATLLSLILFPQNPSLKIQPQVRDVLPLRHVLRNPGVYVPTISLFAVNLCFGSIMTFLPLLLLSRGSTQFSGYYVAYAISVIVSRMWVNGLCRRLTAERLSSYILLLFALTTMVAGVIEQWWITVVCGAGIGISYGLAFPAMATTVATHTQPANRGVAFGFFSSAVDVGFGVGAIGMGMIAAVWDYKTVFLIVGSYTLLYTLFYHFWFRYKITNIVT